MTMKAEHLREAIKEIHAVQSVFKISDREFATILLGMAGVCARDAGISRGHFITLSAAGYAGKE